MNYNNNKSSPYSLIHISNSCDNNSSNNITAIRRVCIRICCKWICATFSALCAAVLLVYYVSIYNFLISNTLNSWHFCVAFNLIYWCVVVQKLLATTSDCRRTLIFHKISIFSMGRKCDTIASMYVMRSRFESQSYDSSEVMLIELPFGAIWYDHTAINTHIAHNARKCSLI